MVRRAWHFLLLVALVTLTSSLRAERPNLLIITVDDMSCDSVGAFGCELAETTPTIDALAAQGLRYHYAHVQVGNCYPSRNVMFSGRYPHNTGVEGFYQVPDPGYPHLVDLFQAGGYFVGIRGKVSHSTPYQPYGWDADLTTLDGQKQGTKDVDSYYRSTKRGIQLAQEAGKPFCLNINISDPHKPFYAMNGKGTVVDDPHVPSRVFTPAEVPIPGFLFDHPDVRLELAHYYSSVRRADDCLAATLKALDESGQREKTAIVFLSDHGMPLPFAKTALWHHSTRTPWIVVWPGVTQAGAIDREHMISAVDLLPTVLDIAQLEHPKGMDGRSFAPTLHGQRQADREMVYKVYNENSGANRSPMRSVQTKRFGYLFNPWSDGERVFRTATTGTMSYRALAQLAESDETLAQRYQLFRHGVVEEFYDYEKDPDALHNLIDDPQYASEIERHRQMMRSMMMQTGDHALEAFDHRDQPELMSAYVDRVQREADERRAARRKPKAAGGSSANASRASQRGNAKLFTLEVPKMAEAGGEVEVQVHHRLPEALGSQMFHVTLKNHRGQRISRQEVEAAGTGTLHVKFSIPEKTPGDAVSVATFVGPDFAKNLLHRNTGPIRLSR